jgi:esterase/lipase
MKFFERHTSQDIQELKDLIQTGGARLNSIEKSMELLADEFKDLESALSVLKMRQDNVVDDKKINTFISKMEALELWKGEMMRLLTSETNAGRPKLSSHGQWLKKRF